MVTNPNINCKASIATQSVALNKECNFNFQVPEPYPFNMGLGHAEYQHTICHVLWYHFAREGGERKKRKTNKEDERGGEEKTCRFGDRKWSRDSNGGHRGDGDGEHGGARGH